MATKTKRVPRAAMDAAAKLQQPGTSATFSGAGVDVEFTDPRAICADLAARIEAGEIGDDDLIEAWPGGEEFAVAAAARMIGDAVIRHIHRLYPCRGYRIGYLFRDKKSWESKGRTVFGKCTKPSGPLQFFSRFDYLVIINWRIWQGLNPWQRVALVYHELRHIDVDEQGKPTTQGHEWEGFFDELELFGAATYREWQALAHSVDNAARVSTQYDLPLLGVED